MEENILIRSTRYDVKKACIIIVIIGAVLSMLLAVSPLSGWMDEYNKEKGIYLEHQEDGECGWPYESWEKCWACEGIEAHPTKFGNAIVCTLKYDAYVVIPIVVAILIGGLLYFWLHCYELTVTDKRVYGKTAFGARVDLPVDAVSAIATVRLLKGVAVSTSSGKISFLIIKNADEIYSVVSDLLIKRQQETNNATAKTNIQTVDEAEQLKKYKELLDSGVITQEEFDAKKKQLLGV